MRRPLLTALSTVLVLPVFTVMPAMTRPGPAAKPVPASIASVALQGVDRGALAETSAARAGTSASGVEGPSGVAKGASPGPAVLTGRLNARPFQTLGVTWDVPGRPGTGRSDVRVQVRWRAAASASGAGSWSSWTALENADDPSNRASDSVAGVRPGTDPLWTGPADGVQVRVDATGGVPHGLRAELVDPGSSDYDARVGQQAPGAASATAAGPSVYRRAQWGADESKRLGTPEVMTTIQAGVLHHTAGMNAYSAAQVPGIIRGDYAYHLSRGWNDIGYNFLVDRFGRVWEGRAGGIDKPIRGAHAGGFNHNTVGVAVLGNYESAQPNSAIVDAVARIFAWKLDLYHRDPLATTSLTSEGGGTSRYAAGTVVTKPVVMGHRDVGYTACPGKNLYPLLPSIRARTVAFMGASLASPALSRTTTALGAGFGLSATALRSMAWRMDVSEVCTGRPVGAMWGSTSGRARFTATWSGRSGATPYRPGQYRFLLGGSAGANPARPVGGVVTVVPPASPPLLVGGAAVGAGGYTAVTPARLLDTRRGAVYALGATGRTDLQVLGRGGVPTRGVTAVALTVTTLCPTTGGFLTVLPAGANGPWIGTTSMPVRSRRSVTVVVPVGAQGKVSLRNALGITDVAVDILGWFGGTTSSRTVVGPAPAVIGTADTVIGARVRRAVSVPTLFGVAPSRITGVWMNVTTRSTSTGGCLAFSGPTGALAPVGQVCYEPTGADHLVLVPVRAGRLTVLNANTVPVSMTLAAEAVQTASPPMGGRVTALAAPVRAFDSRTAGAPIGPTGTTFTVAGGSSPVPASATAVLVNLTGMSPSASTTVTGAGAGAPVPSQPLLRIARGDGRANLAVVPVGSGGRITLRTAPAASHVVVDVVGWVG